LLLNLTVPRINDYMTTAIVDTIYSSEGEALPVGTKLFDLTIDLSRAVAHDCPPISYFRVVLRERAWLRRLSIAEGDEPATGEPLALFSTEPDESLDAPAARPVRVAIAAILHQPSRDPS
jgi:hypothetical protein